MKLKRITINPEVCTGKPCIRDLRFPVSRVLGLLASGETKESILKAYPYLESGDIGEALQFAAYLVDGKTVENPRLRNKLFYNSHDPDEGLEHKEEVIERLKQSMAAVERGEQGIPIEQVAKKFGLEW